MRILSFVFVGSMLGALFVGNILWSSHSQADEIHNHRQSPHRIKGEYLVADVAKTDQGTFKVTLTSTKPTGNFDELTIECRNLHVEIKESQNVMVAAEFLGHPSKKVELSQLLVYLPVAGRRIPVWLTSINTSRQESRASKLLEMHAPSTDYQLF